MTDIRKMRNVISDAYKEDDVEMVADLKKLPCDMIFEDDNGMTFMFMYIDRENLDEGLKDNLSSLFKGAKNLMGDLKSGTEDAYKKAMRKVTTKNYANMSKEMKRQVKAMTKRLKDKYFFDYNVVLQKYEQNNKLYSKEFFEDLISTFGLSPEAEKEVISHFRPQYTRMYNSMSKMYKEYQSENPNAEKPKPKQVFAYLPKKLKKQVADDYNYLVGSIVGFTAAVAIADYFKRNPAKFKECNELNIYENDINNILFDSHIEKMIESVSEFQNNAIMESLETNRDDEGFDWNDDIEEEHDSIFKQYIEDKK